MLSLAAQTNAIPLPSVPEVFGVRLPSSPHVLTQVDFDLVPKKPPPTVKQYEEEIQIVYDKMNRSTHEIQYNMEFWTKESTLDFVRKTVHSVMEYEVADGDDIFQIGCDR